MPLTLETLTAEMRPFANDLCVLYDHDLVRLVGVAETNDDFYYIVRAMGGEETWASAVGRIISLKPFYPAEHYARMDSIFTLNNAPPVEPFRVVSQVSPTWVDGTARDDDELDEGPSGA